MFLPADGGTVELSSAWCGECVARLRSACEAAQAWMMGSTHPMGMAGKLRKLEVAFEVLEQLGEALESGTK